MGKPQLPKPVKLFVGMLAPELEVFYPAIEALEKCFGPVDFESFVWPWEGTDHYTQEIGPHLLRKFVFFKDLISPDGLGLIKQQCNALEEDLGEMRERGFCRRVNLDPGYLDEPKLVLATTKNFSHRIYLQGGIYAEVTLIYDAEGGFCPQSYTYPDYRSATYLSLFNQVRESYRKGFKMGE